MLDLSPMTVLRQIRAGIIPAEQYCKGAPWGDYQEFRARLGG
jgi:hypothetical protein